MLSASWLGVVFVLLHCGLPLTFATNYYEDLGLDNKATSHEIRQAYRQLALKYHPDRNPDDPKTEEKFIKIAKAYEVLSDPESRRQYDETLNKAQFDSKQSSDTYSAPFQHSDSMSEHMKFHQQAHQEALRRAEEIFKRATNFHEQASHQMHSAFNHEEFHQNAARRAKELHKETLRNMHTMNKMHFNTFQSTNDNQHSGQNCQTTVVTNGNTVTKHVVCN